MANFSDGFEEYLPPTDAEWRLVFECGIVILDTNVLLDLYRIGHTAREELMSALGSIRDRLWLPHRVSLEFHRRRHEVMASQGDAYEAVANAIDKLKDAKELADLRSSIYELSNRIMMASADRDSLMAELPTAADHLMTRIRQLKEVHARHLGDTDGDDPILGGLREIFDGKVGAKPSEEALDVMRAEGRRRVEERRPPGYKDGKSEENGDYIIWRQVLDEASARKASVLFVTRDVKEDWFLRHRGKLISGRPELVREALEIASAQVIITHVTTFLHHFRRFNPAAISEETVRQAVEVARSDQEWMMDELRIVIPTERLVMIGDYIKYRIEYVKDSIDLERERLLRSADPSDNDRNSPSGDSPNIADLLAESQLLREMADWIAQPFEVNGKNATIRWVAPPSLGDVRAIVNRAKHWAGANRVAVDSPRQRAIRRRIMASIQDRNVVHDVLGAGLVTATHQSADDGSIIAEVLFEKQEHPILVDALDLIVE